MVLLVYCLIVSASIHRSLLILTTHTQHTERYTGVSVGRVSCVLGTVLEHRGAPKKKKTMVPWDKREAQAGGTSRTNEPPRSRTRGQHEVEDFIGSDGI